MEKQNIMLNTLLQFLNYGLVCVTSHPSFVEYACDSDVLFCRGGTQVRPSFLKWHKRYRSPG